MENNKLVEAIHNILGMDRDYILSGDVSLNTLAQNSAVKIFSYSVGTEDDAKIIRARLHEVDSLGYRDS